MKAKNKMYKVLKILTIISFLLFIFLYYHLAFRSVNRYFLEGLIFGVPVAFLAVLTYCSYKKEIDNWNHDYVVFIAINNEDNEIIFQTEVW